ncbi:MAG: subtype B tannase, partial [Bacteroidales bacterium]
MLKRTNIPVAIALASCFSWVTAGGQSKDPLIFPKDNFTVETRTVKTSSGEKKITYHSYRHIQYVAKPIDKDFQSMDLSVPVKIDDVTIEATNAPIFFSIGIGGYMSVRNVGNVVSHAGADAPGGMGAPPASGPGGQPGGMLQRAGGSGGTGSLSSRADLALAAGFVVVTPGCRGRDNKADDGTFYGKAPAAIVDLKAAVRYLRHNKGILPGNVDQIISAGCSAGGAVSALLGTSGNSPQYDSYLKEIGAADADDNIFGSACYSPITDLENADGAYEWMYGAYPSKSGLVDQEISKQLKALYEDYQLSLKLQGKNGFGFLTADNYKKYLLQYFLIPSANEYLKGLTEENRYEYLAINKWITWTEKGASFSFRDYVSHVGRMKSMPAFDDFNRTQPEPILFGDKTTDSRHFTNFSLQHSTGDKNAMIDNDLKMLVNMMNAN